MRDFNLSGYLREWLAGSPKTKGNVRLEVDVDPQSFFKASRVRRRHSRSTAPTAV
jgi:hypothetical protein